MNKYTTAIAIDGSPAIVWAVLIESNSYATWNAAIPEVAGTMRWVPQLPSAYASGTGTYTAFTPNTNRCGGGTLRGSGTATVPAARVEDRVSGYVSFDKGWLPPYSAVQTALDLLDGQFLSIDAGQCPMPVAIGSGRLTDAAARL